MRLYMGYMVRFWDANGNLVEVNGETMRLAEDREKALALVYYLGDEAMDNGAIIAEVGGAQPNIFELHREGN
jgi:hypothetical protein